MLLGAYLNPVLNTISRNLRERGAKLKKATTASQHLPAIGFNYAPASGCGLFALFVFPRGPCAFSKEKCFLKTGVTMGHLVTLFEFLLGFLLGFRLGLGFSCESKNPGHEEKKRQIKEKKQ